MHARRGRVTLLERVVAAIDSLGVSHALIGATALAVHGVSRSTADVDLLTTDSRVLSPEVWLELGRTGVRVDLRVGDADDPLAGVVRFEGPGERTVDLVVGRARWQQDVVSRAEPTQLPEGRLAVARPADLVLLKLFAGGPQDAWDVTQLLAGEDREGLVEQVDRHVGLLPEESRRLWERIKTQ